MDLDDGVIVDCIFIFILVIYGCNVGFIGVGFVNRVICIFGGKWLFLFYRCELLGKGDIRFLLDMIYYY